MVVNGQIMKIIKAISSHWSLAQWTNDETKISFGAENNLFFFSIAIDWGTYCSWTPAWERTKLKLSVFGLQASTMTKQI